MRIARIPRLSATFAALLATAGCSALSSQDPSVLTEAGRGAGRGRGEVYYLPRSVIAAELRFSPTTGLSIALGTPVNIADTGAGLLASLPVAPADLAACAAADRGRLAGPFMLSHRVSGFHIDSIKVEVKASLLVSAAADTQEQVSATAAAAAGSAGRILAMNMRLENAATDERLLSLAFDPGDCRDVAAVNTALRDAIIRVGVPRLQAAGIGGVPFAGLAAGGAEVASFGISLDGHRPFRFPPTTPASARDCEVGVCVPVPTPAFLTVRMGGQTYQSAVMNLPNGSDPVAIPIWRSAFANVRTVLAFEEGVLTSREVVRSSEALALAKLPGDVVGALVTGILAGFDSRTSLLEKRSALAQAQADAKAKAVTLESKMQQAPLPTMLTVPIPGLSMRPAIAPALSILPQAASPTLPRGPGSATTPGNDGEG